jgi:high-affinity nickel permease
VNPFILLSSAAILGFRHGIDWDHIAAIMDIVGTTTNMTRDDSRSYIDLQRRALTLSSLYALGHAAVVAMLGIAALVFAAILPKWVDPIMERVVGYTLLLLGVWVMVSLVRHCQGKENFQLQSRWMILFALSARVKQWLLSRITGRSSDHAITVKQYGRRTAFGIGMIHGIGAETGTQVLLIGAIGGASSQGLGIAMLLAFLSGLVISNTMVAVCGATGFITSARMKPVYLLAGLFAGIFSLSVGTFFALGEGDRLPDLQKFFGA